MTFTYVSSLISAFQVSLFDRRYTMLVLSDNCSFSVIVFALEL